MTEQSKLTRSTLFGRGKWRAPLRDLKRQQVDFLIAGLEREALFRPLMQEEDQRLLLLLQEVALRDRKHAAKTTA